jgi:hypothetical protein
MKYARVVKSGDDRLSHVVKMDMFFDGTGKSVCGVKVWPGKWVEANGQALCVDCRDKIGRRT